jgi:AcrR family transcriptional regulator
MFGLRSPLSARELLVVKNGGSFYIEQVPKVSTAHREARRRQILEAATVRAARDGFHGMTMGDLIEEAGLSAGAVYGYFPSKTALIRTICDEALGFTAHRLEELAAREGVVTVPLVLSEFLGAALETHGERSPRIAVQVWAEAGRDAEVAAMAAQRIHGLRDVLATLLRRCVEDGTLVSESDPDTMAMALLAFLPGYVVQHLVAPDISADAYLGGVLGLLGARLVDPAGE